MQQPSTAARFLVPVLGAFLGLGAAVYLDLAVLWRAGELRTVETLGDPDFRAKSLYGGLSISLADYKYAAYRRPGAAVVAIGTSRALQFRAHFFTSAFYNLGGLVQGPEQANLIASRLLLREPRPQLVIFAVDFWTLCRTTSAPMSPVQATATAHDGMGEPERYFLIYRLLREGRFLASDYVNLFTHRRSEGRTGLSAVIGSSGFAADGSLYDRPDSDPPAARFQGTAERVKAGAGQFVKDCGVSPAALASLQQFVAALDADRIAVALMLAPVAPQIADLMRADGRYAYIDELRGILARRYGARFFDFFDAHGMSPDSEFLDGFHGGEVTYMRMTAAAARRPDSPLRGFVDVPGLEARIAKAAGRTYDPQNPLYGRFFSRAPALRAPEPRAPPRGR